MSPTLPPMIFVGWTAPGSEASAPAWDGVVPLVWDFGASYTPPTVAEIERAVIAAGVSLGQGDEAITVADIARAIAGAIEQRRSSTALGWTPERSTLQVLIRTGKQAEAHTRREGRIARGFEER